MATYLKSGAFILLCGAVYLGTILLKEVDLSRGVDYAESSFEIDGIRIRLWLQNGSAVDSNRVRDLLSSAIGISREKTRSMGIQEAPHELTLTITKDEENFFLRAKATTFISDTSTIRGYFDPNRNDVVVIASDPGLKGVLTHELTHAILANKRKIQNNMRQSPLWLEEGLAEYVMHSADMQVLFWEVDDMSISIKRVLSGDPKDFYGGSSGLKYYCYSALLVAYLFETKRDNFIKYLDKTLASQVSDGTFVECFGDPDVVAMEMKDFIRKNLDRFGQERVKDIR